jgi:nucleoside-diphosphate-sugar epimerase
MVTINQLVDYACEIGGKKLSKMHIDGPLGVAGRNSDNKLIKEKLDWAPSASLHTGLVTTYKWIESQVHDKCTVTANLK